MLVDTSAKYVYVGRLSGVSGDNTTLQVRDRTGTARATIPGGGSIDTVFSTNSSNFIVTNYAGNALMTIANTGAATFSSSVTIGGTFVQNPASGTGGLYIDRGTSSTSPYISWFNGSGTRLGYMGYSNSNIGLYLENSANFTITGGNVNIGIGAAIVEVGSTGLNGKLGIRFGGSGRVGLDTRDDDDTSNCNYIVFRKADGINIGSITRNGLTNAVLYNTTSDYRLKEDFKEINGLDKIAAIKVYDFKWKGFEDRMDGVIAHELQEIMPYAVHGEKDAIDENGNIKSQGVDYSKLVPILIKGMQEQQAQIQELSKQNEELYKELNDLKALVATK